MAVYAQVLSSETVILQAVSGWYPNRSFNQTRIKFMKIKGLTIKTTPVYVKKNFPARYQEWLNALPAESKTIMTNHIVANEWYPMKEALTIPLRVAANLFFPGDWKKGVWEMGRFDAEDALTGIYKLYVKLGTPSHLISRASRIMAAYYDDAEINIVPVDKNKIILHIVRFDEPDEAIEFNMAGWIQRALEISGCRQVDIELTQSLAKGDKVSEFIISWN